jgi:crotonobetainyl-CoA:carnitine CoA-transferase CaiB-like acyl-CoA transferase
VIKVERPVLGDDSRAFGPPFIEGESTYFMSFNHGKKSITLNLRTEKGKEIIRSLVEKSDVLLENFRPGYMEAMGFGYGDVEKINPRIIYASISGFGQSGPEKDRPGYDLVVQGMGGIMGLTGLPDGPPCKVGTSLSDILAGIYAFQGILLALIAREKYGIGQKVDVSMLDGQVSLLTYQAGIYFATGKAPARRGNEHPSICPYETFKASDDYINISLGNDAFWQKFCNLVGLEEIREDPRFASNPQRVKNRPSLLPYINDILSRRTAEEWIRLFDEHRIPCGPILSIDRVLSHPQVLSQEMVQEIDHPKAGRIKVTGIPIKLSRSPGRVKSHPPLLGEHNDQVLGEILQMDAEEIDTLKREGVL